MTGLLGAAPTGWPTVEVLENRRYVTKSPDRYRPIHFLNKVALDKVLAKKILINQTSLRLSGEEIEVLCLGLNFIPPPVRTLAEREAAFERSFAAWARRIDLAIHFHREDGTVANPPTKPSFGWLGTAVPSTWLPPLGDWRFDPRTQAAKNMLRLAMTKEPPVGIKEKAKARRVRDAIEKLQSAPGVHILKADKGRSTVIWKEEDYDAEADSQLSDRTTYREMGEGAYLISLAALAEECHSVADSLHREGCLTKREYNAMMRVTGGRGSAFYLLPKIHKAVAADGHLKGRPIVATHSIPTHLLDKFITNVTGPLLKRIPGSLRDTTDLLERLDRPMDPPLPDTAVIVTSDVNALYPSIPWEEGIAAAGRVYNENLGFLRQLASNENRPPPPGLTSFITILRLVLENSYIHFKNRRFFKQLSGTAMGMCISVFFANAYMFTLTERYISRPPPGVRLFVRFIDDILVIFDDATDAQVTEFFAPISNEHISYVVDPVGRSQSFLDVRVIIETPDNRLAFEPFWKPTASGSYLHPATCHPEHTTRAIPHSQFLRLRRNSSDRARYVEAAKRLQSELIDSGYDQRTVSRARKVALAMKPPAFWPWRENSQLPKTKHATAAAYKLIFEHGSESATSAISQALNQLHGSIVGFYDRRDQTLLADMLTMRGSSVVTSIGKCIAHHFTGPIKQGDIDGDANNEEDEATDDAA